MRDPRPPRRRPDSRKARAVGASRDSVRPVTRKAESARAVPAALRLLAPCSGRLVAQASPSPPPNGFQVVRASHPVPDEGSLKAGEAAMRLIDRLGPGDLLLVLLSGGASALFEATPVPLEDLRTATVELLRSGLGIRDVNEVRKGLSKVKGGRLAERASARGATMVGLILS